MKNKTKFRPGTLVNHNNSQQVYFVEDICGETSYIKLDEGARGGPSKKVLTCELTRSKRQNPLSWEKEAKKTYRGNRED